MGLYKLAWIVWIGGSLLIVLSWTGVVSNDVGWVGFVVCFIGVVMSGIPHLQAKARTAGQSRPTGDEGDRASQGTEGP